MYNCWNWFWLFIVNNLCLFAWKCCHFPLNKTKVQSWPIFILFKIGTWCQTNLEQTTLQFLAKKSEPFPKYWPSKFHKFNLRDSQTPLELMPNILHLFLIQTLTKALLSLFLAKPRKEIIGPLVNNHLEWPRRPTCMEGIFWPCQVWKS